MQTALIAFEVAARINRIDVDLRAIVREYGISDKELSTDELLRITKNYDFKAKLKRIPLHIISKKYPLPAIIHWKDNSYGVLLKINEEENKVLVFDVVESKTNVMTFEELEETAFDEFIILKHKKISSQVQFGFKWFYYEIIKFKQVIAEVMVGSFIVQLFGLSTPLFIQVVIDKVLVHNSMTTLEVLAVAFLAIAIFELLLNLARKYIFIHMASKLDAKLGAKLFKHLISLPFVYFESRKVGNIIARVRELDTIRDFITNKSVSVIIDLLFSVVFVAVMYIYSVKLTMIVLGFVAVLAILFLTITPELRKRLEGKFQMGAKSNSYLVESVTGIQTVKSLAIEGSMQSQWEDYLGNYVNSSFKLSNMSNITIAISATIQRLITLTVLYVGVKLVIEGKLSIGQLIAFNMLSGQFTAPIMRLVNLWHEFQQALLSVDRLGDILNNPVEIKSSKAITLPDLKGSIRLENVCFKYTQESPYIIEKLTLDVKPGTSIGIVGRSGSGKSTIAKLIQRLYIANEGAIYIDSIDIRHLNPVWLRHNIGVVLQESYLFSGTIRENIALPRPDAPVEIIMGAADMAGAHEFISQLPEGYDTIVGERGSTLSGGQKQRIAIARALITKPKILIFDEATSSLDYESEKIIQGNLEKIKQGRTMFIIAHRLSTVKDCDILISIDKGKIMEMGSHNDLISQKGHYHELYTQQEVGLVT